MKGHGGGTTDVDGEVNTYDKGKAICGLEYRVVNCIVCVQRVIRWDIIRKEWMSVHNLV